MKETIKCPECGTKIVNNTEKHKYRQKLCPKCLTPYTTPSLWTTGIDFRKAKKTLQKIFSFTFRQHGKRKEVYFECPKCHHLAYHKKQTRFFKVPDKFKTLSDGTQVVTAYRYVPMCPKCMTFMTRRTRED